MSKAQSRRPYRKLLLLSLLLVCMAFLTAVSGARSTDRDPVDHGSCCIDQFNTCNAQCAPICDASGCYSDYNCEMACNRQYSACTSPGGDGGPCYIQPEEPCPGCAAGCDVMQQECIDSGGDPRSCVLAGFRCRQSCYVGCPQ